MEALLQQAVDTVSKLNDLEFVSSIRCDFNTVVGLYQIAEAKGIEQSKWLPAIYLWLVLDFACKYKHKQNIYEPDFYEVEKLARYLKVPGNAWVNNIKLFTNNGSILA